MPRFELSVLIATRNRSAMLRDTLLGLARQRFPAEKWELIVIDNGRTDDTQRVLNPCTNLNLEIISEVKAGKSRALNSALDVARGDILVFTDDDVTPARSWLVDLVRTSRAQQPAMLLAAAAFPWTISSLGTYTMAKQQGRNMRLYSRPANLPGFTC